MYFIKTAKYNAVMEMMMMFLGGAMMILVIWLGLVFFRQRKRRAVYQNRRITITGNAMCIRGEPVIIADSGAYGVYFIKDMKAWEPGWLYKRIRVIGELDVNDMENRKYICDPVIQKISNQVTVAV